MAIVLKVLSFTIWLIMMLAIIFAARYNDHSKYRNLDKCLQTKRMDTIMGRVVRHLPPFS